MYADGYVESDANAEGMERRQEERAGIGRGIREGEEISKTKEGGKRRGDQGRQNRWRERVRHGKLEGEECEKE